jgi:hypothetical protein
MGKVCVLYRGMELIYQPCSRLRAALEAPLIRDTMDIIMTMILIMMNVNTCIDISSMRRYLMGNNLGLILKSSLY